MHVRFIQTPSTVDLGTPNFVSFHIMRLWISNALVLSLLSRSSHDALLSSPSSSPSSDHPRVKARAVRRPQRGRLHSLRAFQFTRLPSHSYALLLGSDLSPFHFFNRFMSHSIYSASFCHTPYSSPFPPKINSLN